MAAREIGYPLVVRPSYVLGGRAMEVVYSDADLARYIREAVKVSNDSPVLLDRFLDNAVEVDVDVIADREGNVLIGGVMEHIEEAGVHSGDSSCSLPPYSLSADTQDAPARAGDRSWPSALNVIGLMNTQFAIQTNERGEDTIFLLEVNPRASRTVPFVSKAIGQPLAKIAARCMAGKTPGRAGRDEGNRARLLLGQGSDLPVRQVPERRSDPRPGDALHRRSDGRGPQLRRPRSARAEEAANIKAPQPGKAFVSVRDPDKARVLPVARYLLERGFSLVATEGTADVPRRRRHRLRRASTR